MTKKAEAHPHPQVSSRRFIIGFIVSLFAMMAAAAIYAFVGERFVFDLMTKLLVAVLAVLGALIGLWLVRTGEKHAGYGIFFGSLFGIVLGIVALTLIALLLIAFPVTGVWFQNVFATGQ